MKMLRRWPRTLLTECQKLTGPPPDPWKAHGSVVHRRTDAVAGLRTPAARQGVRARVGPGRGGDRSRPAIIAGLAEIGAFAMGLPESLGGYGASLADLAVIATESGAHLAMAPVVEALVAGRALPQRRRADRPRRLDQAAASGSRLVTFAPRPHVTAGRPRARRCGRRRRRGSRRGRARTRPLAPGEAARVPNTAATALGDLDLSDLTERIVLASGGDAHEPFASRPRRMAGAHRPRWLVGLGRSALDLGVGYAKERKQFGVPIGSFQAVAHRLADVATALDGAQLLAAKAVWALDEGERRRGRACRHGLRVRRRGRRRRRPPAALHFHGGYGFMEEYDIQLYFRRAKARPLAARRPRAS